MKIPCLLIASTLAASIKPIQPIVSWSKDVDVMYQVPVSKRDLMILDFYHTLDQMGKVEFTTELIAAKKNKEKTYHCDGKALKKCLIVAGVTGAAMCGLAGVETLGFSCAGAIIASGLGAAGCVYTNCDYN